MDPDLHGALSTLRNQVMHEGRPGFVAALRFLQTHRANLLRMLGGCHWLPACTDPSTYWEAELDGLQQALQQALHIPAAARLPLSVPRPLEVAARQAWQAFEQRVLADTLPATRWVIRTHLNEPPFWGQTMCTPSASPAPGETSYPDRAMCEYALYRSPPNSTRYAYSTQCAPWGCGQRLYGMTSSAVSAGPPQ